METNERITRLARLLDEAQRALDVLAADAAGAGAHAKATEASDLAMRIRARIRRYMDAPGPNQPGYPGPCPEGMDWGRWLAANNVD